MNDHVCMFPGQGSQFAGMGADLFDAFPSYLNVSQKILGYDIKNICIKDSENQLDQTLFTQPAIFVVNALSYLKHVETHGVPKLLMGHSLGEFSALWAAGVLDFPNALSLVKQRAELMSEVKDGGMAAVIGLDETEVEAVLKTDFPGLDLANINTYNQIVIAGPKLDIEAAQDCFSDLGAAYIILPVSGAFHSRQMRPLQEQFSTILSGLDFKAPGITVLANTTALPHTLPTLKENLAKQICSPVRWLESVTYILNQGEYQFYETGPKESLTNMLKKIKRDFSTN